MHFFDLQSLSLPVLIPIFVVSALLVFWAGTRLSYHAESLSDKTGLGKAFVGSLFLGGITSLPEVATTLTAVFEDQPQMAASNLLGGVAMQVTLLAIADSVIRKNSLSSLSSNAVVLLQGVTLIFSLTLVAAFVLVPGFALFHIGIGSIFVFIAFLISLYLVHQFRFLYWLHYNPTSRDSLEKDIELLQKKISAFDEKEVDEKKEQTRKTIREALFSKTGTWLLGLSVAIFIGGFMVVRSSEVIAAKTGLSANLAGFVLIALTTSLPELSTTISSVRNGQYELAFSNIMGTNLFDLALLFVADLFYFEKSIFQEIHRFALFGALLGVLVTGVYMLGLIIRSKKQFWRMGYDSLVVILLYLGGVVVLSMFQ
jgi:cation:H+ antiporter